MAEDRFATYDAPYVLGALSPRDRQEFELHLRDCADCARAVRELAGMPGLLSKVPPDLVPAGEPPDLPPATLLPALLDKARRQQRRSRWTTIATSVTAAAACLVLAVVLTLGAVPTGERPVSIPTVTMSPVRDAPVWATIGLEDVEWGTKVNMHCMYEKKANWTGKYVLVVVDKHGEVERIGSWTVRPGKDAELQGATSWPVRDIASVEIRTTSGAAVLRMRP